MQGENNMAQEFSVGDITDKGVVVSVEYGGYVGVQVGENVFSYWPQELQGTGERIDPEKLETWLTMNKALDEARTVVYRLAKLQKKLTAESRVPVEASR